MCMSNERAAVRSSGSIRLFWSEATVLPDPNSWTSKGSSRKMSKDSGKRGMTTLVIDESSLRAVRVEETQQFRLIGGGEGIHWELLDEDISVEGIVAGRRSMESAESFGRWLEDRKERGQVE